MYKEIPIDEFFEMYIAAVTFDGHRSTSIGNKKQHCSMIAKFAAERGDTNYSVALGNAFLEQFLSECGEGYEPVYPYPLRVQIVIRTVNTLNDFFLGFPFKRVYRRSKHTLLTAEQSEIITKFVEALTQKSYAETSIKQFSRKVVFFFEFFVLNEIELNNISIKDIERLIASFYGFSPHTIKGYINALKLFLRILFEKEIVAVDLSVLVPYPRIYRKSAIPSVWPKDDLRKMLSAIDTNSPNGKRDMVILLLASKLGMRGGDIRNLCLSDIDWDNDKICYVQQKTGETNILPLLPEIGEAVVEYLRYGRPPSNRPELVLRHNAPFVPFADNAALNHIIVRCAQKADVTLPHERKHGMHSLRHTFASGLLEQNVPPTIIAGLLGHASSETVTVYLKTQDEALRECVLNMSEVLTDD